MEENKKKVIKEDLVNSLIMQIKSLEKQIKQYNLFQEELKAWEKHGADFKKEIRQYESIINNLECIKETIQLMQDHLEGL